MSPKFLRFSKTAVKTPMSSLLDVPARLRDVHGLLSATNSLAPSWTDGEGEGKYTRSREQVWCRRLHDVEVRLQAAAEADVV